MDNWKMISKTGTVDFYRGGWLGVWDAFVAVVKRDKRKTIPTPITCSVWVNAPEGQEVELKIGRSIVMEVSDEREDYGT